MSVIDSMTGTNVRRIETVIVKCAIQELVIIILLLCTDHNFHEKSTL